MLDFVLAAYADPRFLYVAVATVLLSAFSFLAFALPLTWIAARDPAWARRWKIRSERGAGTLSQAEAERRNILVPGPRMVRESLRSWGVNNATMLVAAVIGWPLMSLAGVHLGPLPQGWWWLFPLQLLFCVYFDDLLYYGMHRAMHTRWLLAKVHGRHHRVLAPWAVTGNYMHPVEFVLTGTLAFLGPALLGVHVALLWLWIVLRQWEAADAHCGYVFPWSPTRWLPFSHGALHHDAHHARVRGNYAGFLPHWDRWLRTEVRGYAQLWQDWQARR